MVSFPLNFFSILVSQIWDSQGTEKGAWCFRLTGAPCPSFSMQEEFVEKMQVGGWQPPQNRGTYSNTKLVKYLFPTQEGEERWDWGRGLLLQFLLPWCWNKPLCSAATCCVVLWHLPVLIADKIPWSKTIQDDTAKYMPAKYNHTCGKQK